MSEATRLKVKSVANRLGYEPDPDLHGLTDLRWGREGTRKAPNMAVYTEKKNWSPFFREVATGIEKAARELGYGLELVCEEAYPDARRLVRLLKARGVSAVWIGFRGNNPTWRPLLDLAEYFSDFGSLGGLGKNSPGRSFLSLIANRLASGMGEGRKIKQKWIGY